MNEKLLIVDKNDKFLRYANKEKCHQGKGILHRAFSVYIFNNKGQLLIQKRSRQKPLWPGYWANSCCSHPRKGEEYVDAGERRLAEELGFTCPLSIADKFEYQANYINIGSENEMCVILTGEYNGKVKPNRKELSHYKWVDPHKLINDFKKNPDEYSPWLKIGLKKLLKIKDKEEEYKKELRCFLKKTIKQTDPIIKQLLESYIDKKFHKVIDYQIFTGGKRLRPALTIISAKLFGGKTKDVLYPAAGLEILHNSTLIIDDIIDHSELRRKRPTLWFKYGQSIAECMGLDYLAASFEGANRSASPIEISEIFANTLKTVINGEIHDILFEQRGRENEPYIVKNRYGDINNQKYYDMVGKKTAILAQTCCEVGAISAKASKRDVKLLKDYGFNFGIAFQIRDDILDIFGDEDKFGKKIGKDIEERKLGNIIILLAMRELSKTEKNKLLRVIRKKDIKNGDIKEAIRLIKNTNSHLEACHLAEDFVKKAKDNLKKLPQNKWNKLLEHLVDFSIQREN